MTEDSHFKKRGKVPLDPLEIGCAAGLSETGSRFSSRKPGPLEREQYGYCSREGSSK